LISPNRFAESVIASAGMPSAFARSSAASGCTRPSLTEYSL
jgi:hypothetical protein